MWTDEAKVCEGIMRDYPKIRASLRIHERIAMGTSQGGEYVDGGERLPQQQRILEGGQLGDLYTIVSTVHELVRGLPVDLQRAVVLVYFVGCRPEWAADELSCDESTVRRWCRRALRRMSKRLLRLYDKVLIWREDWDNAIKEDFKH